MWRARSDRQQHTESGPSESESDRAVPTHERVIGMVLFVARLFVHQKVAPSQATGGAERAYRDGKVSHGNRKEVPARLFGRGSLLCAVNLTRARPTAWLEAPGVSKAPLDSVSLKHSAIWLRN